MNYGYGCDPCAQQVQPYYGYPVGGHGGCGNGAFGGFALIVVLFILLVIIGASWCGNW
ncbi:MULTISPECIES: YjcZ family sporulation protein [Cytobacillus]|uniref:YjcZ family sporulation protein n=1 Tax=Cytobacillus stercorigallinarum TaxID=2762240 RepID=A0ABR8QKZ3_9BACI|nr:YjcZ family sporulation protein [Cytobacillus stercorigallinarum]MBD7936190.1 YjcZ family sporulation protein [Cytobacillus stercorigallinarum]